MSTYKWFSNSNIEYINIDLFIKHLEKHIDKIPINNNFMDLKKIILDIHKKNKIPGVDAISISQADNYDIYMIHNTRYIPYDMYKDIFIDIYTSDVNKYIPLNSKILTHYRIDKDDDKRFVYRCNNDVFILYLELAQVYIFWMLEMANLAILERDKCIEENNKTIKKLKKQIKYSPDGKGYHKALMHFNELNK